MLKNKRVVFLLIAVIAIIAVISWLAVSSRSQKASPSARVTLERNSLKIEVAYNRPGKKGREIFGKLVPYDQVWRTGANEATTFTTNEDLTVGRHILKAGSYTLWTIPHADHWDVIFNAKMYPWGVDFDEQPLREPSHDALIARVPVHKVPEEIEEFTISIENSDPIQLSLSWDHTKVLVPLIER